MPSMIYVRHICDRCAETAELEVHPHVQAQGRPEGWQFDVCGGRTSLLCTKCVEALSNFVAAKPPELKVVK